MLNFLKLLKMSVHTVTSLPKDTAYIAYAPTMYRVGNIVIMNFSNNEYVRFYNRKRTHPKPYVEEPLIHVRGCKDEGCTS
jgi:hypothetical protein